MIPILYKANETDFVHNGIGPLVDAISCIVTENRNGAYEAEFVYPINGALYPHITEDCIFKAKPNETSDPQLFRIYKSSKPMNKKVTFYGEHISYCLNGIPIEKVEIKSSSAQKALSDVLAAGIFEHDFTGQSDIETLNSTSLSLVSIRAALGGVEGSLLDVYGGEYEFDNFVVKLHAHRGRDTGIRIAYGKNLTDLKQDRSISEVYTAVYPYVRYTPEATDDNPEPAEITVSLPEKVIYSQYADHYAHSRAYIKDFTEMFEQGEEFTVEKLRAKAQTWAKSSGFDIPTVSITVSFKTLWDSPEYAKYATLERVALCDTLSVFYEDLGVSATAKVIKTVFDVLKERYNSVELGDARSNFADTINQSSTLIENIRQEIKTQATAANVNLAAAIAKATAAITGHSGGCVVLNPSNNPQEVLIMDAPTISEAVNIWRWNSGGLGYSSNGYNGPFKLAITNDGAIVADFITAGTLKGELLEAGSVKANAISLEYRNSVLDAIADTEKSIKQAFTVADEQVISTITETLKEYSTTTETESKITQTSDKIMTEVNKKVNNSDFGTKITQNYSSVCIAWNSISKYIEFSDGAINIYKSTAQGTDNLLMKMTYTGAWYYYSGTTIGKIGTNNWSGDEDFRGLVFDLEYEADYMCWAHRTSASADSYTVQLIYYANNKKNSQGLHFSCKTYCGGNLYINDAVRTVSYEDGSGGLYSANNDVSMHGKGCTFTCGTDFRFGNSTNLLVDCYNNIDLHNYSILNQSDARYKTNIEPTEVEAIPLLSKIELKKFDWIESAEHCEIGMIAQQLRGILPDLVDENKETGRLSIKTDKIIPYLIKAIQEIADYITGGVSFFSADAKAWTDSYTDTEKADFIAANAYKEDLEIVENPEILIPINKEDKVNE